MKRYKLGLVGVGKIARDQHLPVIRSHSAFDLIGVASRNASLADFPSHQDLNQLLVACPEIEAVVLCTPPGPRERDARLALARGIHVLLEKPPAATLGAARELLTHATRSIINASWHSRHAPYVQRAQAWLRNKRIREIEIVWKEDIRRWHPGQDWILDVGGMGVFDPGINALSILTQLVSEQVYVESAELAIPLGRQAPLRATLDIRTASGIPISGSLDFLQEGSQIWNIRFSTLEGELLLTQGGAGMSIDGVEQAMIADAHGEYIGVYNEFAHCIGAKTSSFDLRPLEIVADALAVGRRESLAAFQF